MGNDEIKLIRPCLTALLDSSDRHMHTFLPIVAVLTLPSLSAKEGMLQEEPSTLDDKRLRSTRISGAKSDLESNWRKRSS